MHVVLLITPLTWILLLFISVTCYIDYPVIYFSYLLDSCTLTSTVALNTWQVFPVFLSPSPIKSCPYMPLGNEITWRWRDWM